MSYIVRKMSYIVRTIDKDGKGFSQSLPLPTLAAVGEHIAKQPYLFGKCRFEVIEVVDKVIDQPQEDQLEKYRKEIAELREQNGKLVAELKTEVDKHVAREAEWRRSLEIVQKELEQWNLWYMSRNKTPTSTIP